MKALCVPRGAPLEPWGDPVGSLPVLNVDLAEVQVAAIRRAGLVPATEVAPGEPHVVYSDRTWFSADTVRRLMAAGPGRLQVDDAAFLEATTPLQELPQTGVYELALHPGDGRALEELPPVRVDLGLEDATFPAPHPRLSHVVRPLRIGLAQVHQIDHWSHLLRVNHMALAGMGLELKADFLAAPIWSKIAGVVKILGKARGISEAQVGAALTVRGQGVKIHPTAVVEACQLADGVEIGAHAVVRGAVVGPGARIEEHATVLGSIVGARCIVARYAMVNFCVMMGGSQLSFGGGWQFSIVGREAFVAWGATGLDLSFGGPIKVSHRGQRVSSGHHLLGVCIGHQAVIGNSVRLNHGLSVPNGAVVVASTDDLLRDGSLPDGVGPYLVREGRLVDIGRR